MVGLVYLNRRCVEYADEFPRNEKEALKQTSSRATIKSKKEKNMYPNKGRKPLRLDPQLDIEPEFKLSTLDLQNIERLSTPAEWKLFQAVVKKKFRDRHDFAIAVAAEKDDLDLTNGLLLRKHDLHMICVISNKLSRSEWEVFRDMIGRAGMEVAWRFDVMTFVYEGLGCMLTHWIRVGNSDKFEWKACHPQSSLRHRLCGCQAGKGVEYKWKIFPCGDPLQFQ